MRQLPEHRLEHSPCGLLEPESSSETGAKYFPMPCMSQRMSAKLSSRRRLVPCTFGQPSPWQSGSVGASPRIRSTLNVKIGLEATVGERGLEVIM